LLLTPFTKEMTIVGAILRDEIIAILNNISHYYLILLYRIRSLTEVIRDKRFKEFVFQCNDIPYL